MQNAASRRALFFTCMSLGVGGCATCRDHILVHVEQPQSNVPITGAKVEFRPPLNLLPPPVWRGKTNVSGDVHMCIDISGHDVLQLIVRHAGCEYGAMLSSSDVPQREYVLSSFDHECPQIRVVVKRITND